MPRPVTVIKFGDTAEKALAHYASGTIRQNNLRITKSGAAMTLIKNPEKL